MERLTVWNEQTEMAELIDWDTEEWKEFMSILDVPIQTSLSEAFDKLAHYEDLEEQGLLLKLPCKVGDTIYSVGTRCDFGEVPDGGCDETDCEECYCNDLVIRERVAKKYHIIRFLEGRSQYDFLTKEEAEAKLKEMEGKQI